MDATCCRQVIQVCFPTLAVHSALFLAEGWGSEAWEVNGSYVFRFPKRADIHAGLRKEIRLLPGLAPSLPLAIPCFEYVWPGGPEYGGPFVGYPKIRGVPLTMSLLAKADVAAVATQLGRFLTALHRLSLSQAVALGTATADAQQWCQEYVAMRDTIRRRIFPLLDVAHQRSLDRLWARFLEHEDNFRFTPALIHRDLSSEHILFEVEGDQVTGVIDWEDAAIGDPAFDFTGLLADYGPGFARQVLAAYEGPLDDGFLSRASFYRDIGPNYEVLFGLDCSLPAYVSAGLAGLRAVAGRLAE